MEKLKNTVDIIKQCIDNTIPVEDFSNRELLQNISSLLNSIEDGYVLISFPDSQEFMGEDWFEEEAILHIDEPSSYFIPIKRLI